jgi:CheY-like chemotaxis protein
MPHSLKILVVDDDPDVLTMAGSFLSEQGYQVVEAGNGAHALRVLQENPDIALLLTDVVMPGGIDGFDLAKRAKQMHPGLRVLYTSGFLKNEGAWQGDLLPKPWRLSHLDEAVRRALS